MRGGPHVEVGHLRVGDHAGADEVREQPVVLGGVLERTGGAGTRPALPDDRADRRVPGVLPVPVGRAGRQREEHGQVPGDPLGDLDRELAVGDPDVDLGAADQLLVDEQAVLLLHPPVAAGRGELEVAELAAGCGPDRGDAEPLARGHLDHAGAQARDLAPQAVQGRRRRRCSSRPWCAGSRRSSSPPGASRSSCGRTSGQLPALRVDEVELLLGTERRGGRHGHTIATARASACEVHGPPSGPVHPITATASPTAASSTVTTGTTRPLRSASPPRRPASSATVSTLAALNVV